MGTTTTTGIAATTHDGEILNVERMWRELDDDRGLLADLTRQFRKDYPDQLTQLRGALDGGQGDRVAFGAHRLAGMVGVFAAQASLAAAHRLEDLARAGDLAAAPSVLASLEQELSRLDRLLDRLCAGA